MFSPPRKVSRTEVGFLSSRKNGGQSDLYVFGVMYFKYCILNTIFSISVLYSILFILCICTLFKNILWYLLLNTLITHYGSPSEAFCAPSFHYLACSMEISLGLHPDTDPSWSCKYPFRPLATCILILGKWLRRGDAQFGPRQKHGPGQKFAWVTFTQWSYVISLCDIFETGGLGDSYPITQRGLAECAGFR